MQIEMTVPKIIIFAEGCYLCEFEAAIDISSMPLLI